jgi:hypothetical protein
MMTKSKSRTIATAVSLFLMFAMAVSLLALPAAKAHDPQWKIPTFAFVQAVINPVGVGQTTYIYVFIDKTFGTDTALTNDWRFHNYKLTITKPDGKTETQTWDVVWDPTSAQGYSYTPDQAGTYTLKFEFPGQDYNTYSHNPLSPYVNDTYLSSSAEATLTVLEEPLPEPPGGYPLPTEYWMRPIYGENTNWWAISSDWLGSGSPMLNTAKNRVYVPGGVGPRTSHVMWTKPLQSGGVVGGDNFEIQGDTYFEGSAYLNRFVNPIILDGKLFYTEPISFGSAADGPTDCVDLRTGQVIWSRMDVPKPSFGYIEAVHNPQQHGVAPPMLIATSGGRGSPLQWLVYDADTGDFLFNFTNIPSGATAMGPKGEYMMYVMENAGNDTHPDYRLAQWNSSKLMFQYSGGLRPPWTGTFDASLSSWYDWNISIPWRNTMTSSPAVIAAWYNDIMLCYNGTLPNSGFRTSPVIQDPYTYFAVNLNESKGAVGSVLWRKTYNPPIKDITILEGGADPTLGVFVEKCKETNQWVGYSLRTGDKLWGPVGDQPALDYYGNPGHERVFSFIAYGKVYVSGYGGVIFCYDEMTGDLLWSYGNGGEGNSTSSGFAVARNPISINAIADGILYTVTTEHTIQTPIYKGALARAINATDGTEIWTLSDYTGEFNEMNYALADGYAAWFNGYDNRIYSVGRGPSATTVLASPEVSVHGSSVLVKGTVTDTAAGTKQDEQAARFPNGVPAVSDEDMTEWMEYVYQQKPRPTDVTGVEVVISVLDPNNNCYEVGRATSDENGMFHCAFTPLVPGEYAIYASFEGSEGYWPSQAETAINVEEAPATTPAPPPTPAPMTDTYVLGIGAGAIIAIIAIGLVIILMLRRR